MSAGVYATETLTRVLMEHFGFPNRGGLLDCVCGALRDRTVREHSAHQAAAVIEALELREETKLLDDGMGSIMTAPDGTVTSSFRPQTRVRRLVGPWATEETPK